MFCPYCGTELRLSEDTKFCPNCGKILKLESSEKDAEKTCPFCHALIQPGQSVATCEICGIAHHTECWMQNCGCTTQDCLGKAQISSSNNLERSMASTEYGHAPELNKSESNKDKATNDNIINWFLWWRIGKEELEEQVDRYNIQDIFKTARGWSIVCLLFSSIISFLYIMIGLTTTSSYIDISWFLALAVFIYFRHRWAFIAALILWTIEKSFGILGFFSTTIAASVVPKIIMSLLFWVVYSHIFLLAYKVEVERKKVKNLTIQNSSQINQ